jgi:tripartite-type tricarboxylate transporter receptor subunit TctC
VYQEVLPALSTQEVKQKLFQVGADTSGITPREFAAWISSNIAVMGKIIRNVGIRGE